MPAITDDLERLYAGSDALALADLVRRGEVSAAELVETAIALIERLDPVLNAVVIRTFDIARAAAAEPGQGVFAGVPFLLKNIGSQWKGTPLTNGLGYLRDYVCDTDSQMVRRLQEAGFALLGRSNAPEVGWCITTEPRLYGPTVNPWNPAVTAGGSSGGAAAAVAARLVPIAEATDGGGSIRVPASCCGVVGLKPSRGRITYAPEPDIWFGSIAILCNSRSVRDTAAFLDVTAGALPGDPYPLPRPERSWLAQLYEAPRHLRIGFTLKAPWGEAYDPQVRAAVEDAARLFERFGHVVEEYDPATDLEAAWWAYNDIVAVETAGEFAHYAQVLGRAVRDEELAPFNASLLRHAGTLSATDYSASVGAVRRAGRDIAAELSTFDVFLTPTLTQPPRPVGYWSMEDGDRERYLARWFDAAFMAPFNYSGLPAMSVPGAMAADGTPVGVHLVGRLGDEAALLGLARQMEEAVPWIGRRPPVCAGQG